MQFDIRESLQPKREYQERKCKSCHVGVLERIASLPLMVFSAMPLVSALPRREARTITVTYRERAIHGLPAAFDGFTLAFLTDFHCSRETPVDFIRQVVARTNALAPDVILLGGDYVTFVDEHVDQVGAVLKELSAPFGVYGVLGNHDFYGDANRVRAMLREAGIADVSNAGRWLERGDARLRIAGVSDLWEDTPNLHGALWGMQPDDVAILLSHNPDFAMQVRDPRVKLVLSGHTHGGQIRIPKVGALMTSSAYGQRLAHGLVNFATFELYTSRGIGTTVVPMRFLCPPEIVAYKLRTA